MEIIFGEITIKIKGQEVKLSKQEAEELRNKLNEVFPAHRPLGLLDIRTNDGQTPPFNPTCSLDKRY